MNQSESISKLAPAVDSFYETFNAELVAFQEMANMGLDVAFRMAS